MTISARTKTSENLKLENYRSDINKTCLLCLPGVNQRAAEDSSKTLSKMLKIYQNLDFNQLKTVYKVLKLGTFPIFDDIFTANILEMWEKTRGGLYPSCGGAPP